MNKNGKNNIKNAAGIVITAALVLIFAYSFVMALGNTLINEIVAAFSLEGASEGLMGSLLSVGFILSLLILPFFQGRAKKITVIFAAFALQAAMIAAIGASPTFVLFGVFCVVMGFSGGFVDTYSNSIVVDVKKSDSSKYLGYLHGLYGVGSLIAPLLFIWLLKHTDWRGIYYVMAVFSFVVLLVVLVMARRKTGSETAEDIREQKFNKADLPEYLRSARNRALILAGLFANVAQTGILVWIVRYMTLRFGSADLGAISYSLLWVCATINRFFFSRIVQSSPMKYFTLGSAIFVIGLAVGVFSANPIVLCVMVGVLGLCGGHVFPVLVSECAVGYEGRTSFTTTIVMFVSGIARIATPVLIAFTSQRISLTFGIMIPAAASLLATFCGYYVYRQSRA